MSKKKEKEKKKKVNYNKIVNPNIVGRGGAFVSPGVRKTAFRALTNKQLQRTVKNIIKTQVLSKHSYANAQKVLKAVEDAADYINIAGTKYAQITKPAGEFVGGASSTTVPIPSMEKETVKVLGSSPTSPYSAKTYKIRFTCGKQPTQTLQRLRKNHGSNKVSIYNKEYMNLDPSQLDDWDINAGFNRKFQGFYKHELTVPTVRDVKDLYDLRSGTNWDYTSEEVKIYGSALSFTTNMKFVNVNSYLPCNIRVSLYNFEPQQLEPYNKMTAYCGQLLGQQDNAMPIDYLLAVGTPSGVISYCEVDPVSTGIRDSENFKTDIKIVKSFQRRLRPGDMLDFKYTHLCGPGLRLDKINAATDNASWSENLPLGYGIMVEAWGVQVDAVRNDVTNKGRVIGTGPALLSSTANKSVHLVLADNTISATQSPIDKTEYHARAFFNAPKGINAVTKRYNCPHTQITDGPSGSVGVYIPITTSAQEEYSSES